MGDSVEGVYERGFNERGIYIAELEADLKLARESSAFWGRCAGRRSNERDNWKRLCLEAVLPYRAHLRWLSTYSGMGEDEDIAEGDVWLAEVKQAAEE